MSLNHKLLMLLMSFFGFNISCFDCPAGAVRQIIQAFESQVTKPALDMSLLRRSLLSDISTDLNDTKPEIEKAAERYAKYQKKLAQRAARRSSVATTSSDDSLK